MRSSSRGPADRGKGGGGLVLLVFQIDSPLLRRGCAETEWRRVRPSIVVEGSGGTGGGACCCGCGCGCMVEKWLSEPTDAGIVLVCCCCHCMGSEA